MPRVLKYRGFVGSFARVVRTAALAGTIGACAAVTGLDAYTKGTCQADCDASAGNAPLGDRYAPPLPLQEEGATDTAAPSNDAAPGGDAPGETAVDAAGSIDTGAPEVGNGDGLDGSRGCDGAACPTSVATQYACSAGGCNAVGGACTSSAQACHCFADTQCPSAKCVPISGQNDLSCGTKCTGAGAADAFGCLLASPGIPAVVSSVFAYAPSNFAPASYSPPSSPTTIDCNTTYDASAHAFTGWCAGQTLPSITPGVAQTGGPPVDVLAFRGLAISAGSTIT